MSSGTTLEEWLEAPDAERAEEGEGPEAPPEESARRGAQPAPTEPCLVLVGTDHRRAPVEIREKVSLGAEEIAATTAQLMQRGEISEALLLSTCNRTEVYLCPRDETAAIGMARELIFQRRAPEMRAAADSLFALSGRDAARHLLAVASGLESMVLGEPEILGQVKQAAAHAELAGGCGPVLSRLLRSALAAGKRARAETAIGTGAVSLGYAVAELARNIFQSMASVRVLMVGAGEISRSATRALLERQVGALTVANRNAERAASFRQEFPATRILPFEERHTALPEVDVVVVSTGATGAVLTRHELAQAMSHRQGRPLLVVDLSVPRNVEPAARTLGNLFLHDVDSLQGLIGHNLSRRREEVPEVEQIVEQELGRYYRWYRSLAAEPMVASIQRQAETVRQRELARVLHRFPDEVHADLDRLTRSLVRKLLHHPSARLRQRDDGDALSRLDLVRDLFQLDELLEELLDDSAAGRAEPDEGP